MSRFCLSPGCPEVVDGKVSYCDRHRPAQQTPWRGSKSEARGWEWRRIRARVLKRDGHRCTEPGCPRVATQVDAIVPSARGGSHVDVDNLRSLCDDHHRNKTDEDRRDGIKRRGGR